MVIPRLFHRVRHESPKEPFERFTKSEGLGSTAIVVISRISEQESPKESLERFTKNKGHPRTAIVTISEISENESPKKPLERYTKMRNITSKGGSST